VFEDAILDMDCLHSFKHCKISVMHIFPNFNKTTLKFPMPWVWVRFPKSWKKYLMFDIVADMRMSTIAHPVHRIVELKITWNSFILTAGYKRFIKDFSTKHCI
jgi:hypothetical protein